MSDFSSIYAGTIGHNASFSHVEAEMFDRIDQPWLMGILNVTPDSFSDGGRYLTIDAALRQAERMVLDGARILDIGGESTRPGASPVAPAAQIARVVPVIYALRQRIPKEIWLSIDTCSSEVARAALEHGAGIINDVSAGLGDPEMLALAAQQRAAIVLMHMQGTPRTMQDQPHYDDVVADVSAFLRQRIDAALQAGVPRDAIAIDPGIGFGKRRLDNLQLLAALPQFCALGYPVLLGTSRKRFMGALCQIDDPCALMPATVATTALGVMAGVKVFRVHDVAANRQALEVAWAIRQAGRSLNTLNEASKP